MFCHKCENALAEGAQFCGKCGHPVNASVSANTVPSQLVLPASIWRRLSDYLIDRVASLLLAGIVFVLAGMFSSTLLSFVAYGLFFGYYLIFESIWQRTLGKVITKTKVVDMQGNKPSFWKLLGRSLSRWIPFEPFSFLINAYPVGWHDSLSGTFVVPASLTPEQVRQIDVAQIKKTHGNNPVVIIITVIVCVLVIVAIVGILSSVVLVSLNTARQKGADTYVKSELAIVRSMGELYFNDNPSNHYLGMCQDATIIDSLHKAAVASGNAESDYICNDTKEAWAAAVPLKSAGYWCADNSGSDSHAISMQLNTQTLCPLN